MLPASKEQTIVVGMPSAGHLGKLLLELYLSVFIKGLNLWFSNLCCRTC